MLWIKRPGLKSQFKVTPLGRVITSVNFGLSSENGDNTTCHTYCEAWMKEYTEKALNAVMQILFKNLNTRSKSTQLEYIKLFVLAIAKD